MKAICGNIRLNSMFFERAGAIHAGHDHPYDHTTFVIEGSIVVKATLPTGRYVEQVFHSGDHVLIKAGVEHQIVALEDNTHAVCIFSIRNMKGEIIQHDIGWNGDNRGKIMELGPIG